MRTEDRGRKAESKLSHEEAKSRKEEEKTAERMNFKKKIAPDERKRPRPVVLIVPPSNKWLHIFLAAQQMPAVASTVEVMEAASNAMAASARGVSLSST